MRGLPLDRRVRSTANHIVFAAEYQQRLTAKSERAYDDDNDERFSNNSVSAKEKGCDTRTSDDIQAIYREEQRIISCTDRSKPPSWIC